MPGPVLMVDHAVQGVDGVSLAAVSAGDPARPTIVLIHGYPETKEMWLPVMRRLAGSFRVIAYDVRGAGGSSAPRGPAAYRTERLSDDFAAVLDAVAGDRPVHLVGHDWGGIQGWEFVTAARFDGRIASFTTVAGFALAHAIAAVREPLHAGNPLRALNRIRRSWYMVPLCLPGGPSVAWRGLFAGGRWRWLLRFAERVPVDADYPAVTTAADGLHGANLYRANIPRRIVSRATGLIAPHCPVQVIVPSGDRFISPSYYEAVERVAPGLWRRTIAGSHWAPRHSPDTIAGWIAELVRHCERPDGFPA